MGRLSAVHNGLRDKLRYAVNGFPDRSKITGSGSYSLHKVGNMQNALPRGSKTCSTRSYHGML